MILFESKTGKFYLLHNILVTSYYDDFKTREQNEIDYYRKEYEAVKDFGFKRVDFSNAINVFKGTAKQLYDFIKKCDNLDISKEDFKLIVKPEIYQFLIDYQAEILTSKIEYENLYNLAYLYKKANYIEKANELFKQALLNYESAIVQKKLSEEEILRQEKLAYINSPCYENFCWGSSEQCKNCYYANKRPQLVKFKPNAKFRNKFSMCY